MSNKLITKLYIASVPCFIGFNSSKRLNVCISNKFYSTSTKNKHLLNVDPALFSSLHPWFVSGFADGESCFHISLTRNSKYKTGYSVYPAFLIGLHKKDKALLELIKSTMGDVGKITEHGKDVVQYRVLSVKELSAVINHFDRYPLITQKRADYELFKQAFTLILNKEHLTEEGIGKIVGIKASINKGLSDELKTAFPDIIPVPRPQVEDPEIKDPHWLAGFTSAEGCFLIRIINSSSFPEKDFRVQLIFKLTQHSRDDYLMKSLIEFCKCGKVFKHSKDAVVFNVSKLSDLNQKIIPFFDKYPILGVKSEDFLDFCKVAELMQNKAHLTEEGLHEIRKIKAGINTGRKFEA